MTFYALNKTSSDAIPVAPVKKEDKLSDKHTLVTSLGPEATPKKLSTVLDLLFAVQMLVHALALAGLDLVDSKVNPGKKTRQCSLTQAYWYRSFIWSSVRQHPKVHSQPSVVINWVVERDRQTRLKAQQLFEQGWPFGEALQQVCETSLSVLWTVGNEVGATAPIAVVSLAPGGATEEIKPPKKDMSQVKTCPDWNSGGCTPKQRDCPSQLRHACNFKVNGKECSDWRHRGQDCPLKTGAVKRKGEPAAKGGGKRAR